MKLEGKLFKANLVVAIATVEKDKSDLSFVKQLEACLIDLCRQLDAPIPLWLDKNTKEFARFHQTLFFTEQFTESVLFDRMQIRWLD